MELSYAQLEAALVTHFRIVPDRIGTFRSKIKQLQRLEFPPGVNIGRGARMTYSAVHLFQMATAFELMNAGLPAAQATNLCASHWLQFAAGYGLAHARRQDLNFKQQLYFRVLQRNFSEIQRDESGRLQVHVFVEDMESLDMILGINSDRVSNTYLIICASDVHSKLIRALDSAAQVSYPLEDPEMLEWVMEPSYTNWWLFADGGWKLSEPLEE